MSAAEIGTIGLDMAAGPVVVLSPDGRIAGFNRHCEALTGYGTDEVVGQYLWDVLAAPEEQNTVRRFVLDRVRAGRHGRMLGQWISRDGVSLRVDWVCRVVADRDGAARAVVGTIEDVTGKVKERAELRERGALLQSIINTSPDAIVVIDDHGIVREFSPTGEEMFGYGADEVIGRNVSMLMPSPYREEHDGYLARYFETGEKRIIGTVRELEAQRKDGSTFPIELMVDEVFVDDVRLFTGFIRDVSSRRAQQEELQNLNIELAHAGRVAALGEMTSAIAHELNQPLTAIANYIAACRQLLDSPDMRIETIRDTAAKVHGQVDRAREIVRHFRTFVRKDQGERDSADLNSLVRNALALGLIGAEEADIATEIRLAPFIPTVAVDGIQIQQVILNLVRNALEALAEVEDRRLLISTAWREADAMAEFAVHDSGPGLAPEVRERLFQPFTTTKAQGMGIGLSLCQSIITAHDGLLWADGNDWGGTTFRFVLPAEVA